jgi:hypothetical protein
MKQMKNFNSRKFLIGFCAFLVWNLFLLQRFSKYNNLDTSTNSESNFSSAINVHLQIKILSDEFYEMTSRALSEDIKDVDYFLNAKLESLLKKGDSIDIVNIKADFQHRMK